MPTNERVNPPQPTEQRYSLDRLYVTPRLTRAIYQERYQEQAPPFDPERRIQRWFFTDVLEGSEDPANELVQFTVWDGKFKSYTCSRLHASTPNLPGALVWPKYENPETTSACLYGPISEVENGFAPLSGRLLVDPAKAKAVLDEINKDLGTKYTMSYPADPWPWKIVWGTETRRSINFVQDNETIGASPLLDDRFKNGVGSPGKWVKSDSGGPQFIADTPPTGESDLRPEVPMVVRPLLPNERIESGFGGLLHIVRTDLSQDEPGPGTGALTVAQDTRLKAVATKLGVGD
ncbi:MAG: hypothetical protein ABFE08_09080 [Armatimonadia bacterium]